MVKKLLTFSVCLWMALTACAQSKETRTYELAPFNAIDASYSYKIEVVKGNSCSLQVQADKEIIDELVVNVSGNTLELSIRQEFWKNFQSGFSDRYTVYAKVTMPDLVAVELGSSAQLNATSPFSPKNFEISLSGASRAKLMVMTHTADIEVSGASRLQLDGLANTAQLEVSGASRLEYNQEVEAMELEVSGASNITMEGSATRADVKLGGASRLEAKDFAVETMQLKCGGASRAEVTVTDKMGVDAGGASNITIHGNPSFTSTHVSGASKLSNN